MRLSTRAVIFGSGFRHAVGGAGGEQQIISSPVGVVSDVTSDGNNNWVVTGSTGVAYSTNKVDWTLSVSSITGNPKSVETDKAGNWVMLTTTNNMYNSTDNGVTWTSRAQVGHTSLNQVAYHPSADKFYVIGLATGQQLISSDSGVTWVDMPALTGNGYQVAATNGSRMIVGSTSSDLKYTDDGVTWATADSPRHFQPQYSMDYGNGGWAFLNAAGVVYYHATGVGSWSLLDPDLGTGQNAYFIRWLPEEGRWVLSQDGKWHESTDLTSWSEITSDDFFGVDDAIDGGHADSTGYVIATETNNLIIKHVVVSSSYQVIAEPVTGALAVATDGAGNWIVAGTTQIAYSSNKVDWTVSASSFAGTPRSVASDEGGNWVMVQSDGDVYHSTDNGATWTAKASPSYNNLNTTFYHKGADMFIALGHTTDHMYSDDGGLTWADLADPANNGWRNASSSATRSIACGDNGYTEYSDDGTTWTSTGLGFVTRRAAWVANGKYVFGGNNGLIEHSSTGSSGWTTTDMISADTTAIQYLFYIEDEGRWIASTTTNHYESTNLLNWNRITYGDFFGQATPHEVAVDSTGYIVLLVAGSNIIIK